MIDIIIPTHNNFKFTKRCIDSISSRHAYTLIVVDDNSTDGTLEYVKEKADLVINAPAPFNFARNVNYGIQAGNGPYTLICNNDIEFGEDAIDIMIDVMETTDYGLVGPSSDGVMNKDQKVLHLITKETHRTLNFFCVLINNIVFEKIGLLDERFTGYGCDDDDFCIRAMQAGFKCAVAPAFVHHDATTSFKEVDKDSMFKHNKALFWEKYGVGPAQDWKKLGIIDGQVSV
jgi:GT2 family glycosyltransferase